MTAIPDEVIEQVRDSADVVHIIGEHVDLRRTGADFRGPCPFHGGTKRNLAVIAKKQMFYCFVCHEGGDVFAFYMKHLGMDYPTAVREVAAKVGVIIPDRPTGGPDPREPLFSAVAVAAEWYAKRLRESPDGEEARAYLAKRGFSGEGLDVLGLGFAPKGGVFLEAMGRLGVSEDSLLEAGLVVRREDGSLRPRFWGRLLFPIHDLRGRVVGFGGRALGDAEPKYLNSPDSRIFHKGQLLYNLHNARAAIRRNEKAVVVEGYFDVLRAVEAGIEHVVAPLGTALTSEQTALLKRYTREVVLLYDNDPSGMRASFRAADEILRASIRGMIATLPPGQDPDSLVVQDGAEALVHIIDDAVDVFERELQLLDRKGWMGSIAGRRRALDRLLPTLRAASDPVTRDLYVNRVAETLGIHANSVRREIDSGVPRRSVWRERPAATGPDGGRLGGGGGSAERNLTRVMVHEPQWRSRIAELVPDTSILAGPDRELFEYLTMQPDEATGPQMLREVDGEVRAVLAQLLEEAWGDLDVDAVVAGAINDLDSRSVEATLEQVQRQLAVAPTDEKVTLTRQIHSLSRRLAELKPGRWNVIRTGRSSAV
ncbi:MAG: DNA primase [Gemmatimonadetes bacterium]|nr:DNA primase [Gemmatimonadota bacterium]